jgi:heat shock protein HslJ
LNWEKIYNRNPKFSEMKGSFKLISLVALILLLNACCCKSRLQKPDSQDTGNSIAPTTQEITVFDTYWKLVELKGNPLTGPSDSTREARLILNTAEKKAFGSGGCNRFSADYTTSKTHAIRFSQLISTKMACEGIDYEYSFFAALERVDNYSAGKDTLYLKAGEETLAKLIPLPKK